MNKSLALAIGMALSLPAFADDLAPTDAAPKSATELKEVVVFGRGEVLIGKADAASEGAVGGDDLLVRPMLRTADLLEAVPGLIAAQHSGSGKANQYFLRGFNLDHGTDFTTYVDDVPWNLRTHGHGQGYLDVNGLIPEVVERIEYRKGTYRAESGDFAMAGSARMTTIDKLEQPFVAVEGGQYGWGRLAGGGTIDVGDGALTLLGQYKTYDGPWQLKEDLQHLAVWGKYATPTALGNLNVTISGYRATWHPTEQMPEAVFGTAICADTYCALDPTAYGKTERWIVGSQLMADDWRATAYAQYYDWHMLSNATYGAATQINQFDRRVTLGGRYERTVVHTDALEVVAGTELRYDDVAKVGVDDTVAGNFVANKSNNKVTESSLGIYGEANWKVTKALRLTAGLRGDLYDFDVSVNAGSGPDGENNTGDTKDSILSPKLGLAYDLGRGVEVYGNWGEGFHSNDARGVNKHDDAVPGLVKGTGYETGARFEVGDFKISVAYWWLNLTSELIFVGDDNTVEPKGSSSRHGYELVAFWRPVQWLGIDAVYTGSHARYDHDQEGGGRYIEGGVENAGELGIAATKAGWELSARLRYLGPYPLVPDNSHRAEGETMLNLRAAYNFSHVTLYGELLNALNHDGKDIVYWYETELAPEGRVSRAEEPRTIRAGIKYKF